MIKIPIKFLDNNRDPDHQQNLLVCRYPLFQSHFPVLQKFIIICRQKVTDKLQKHNVLGGCNNVHSDFSKIMKLYTRGLLKAYSRPAIHRRRVTMLKQSWHFVVIRPDYALNLMMTMASGNISSA